MLHIQEGNMRGNIHSQKLTSLTIVRAGLFIAMSLVLKTMFEFYINLAGIPALRIGFSSIPLMLSGIVLGPSIGFITGAAADIINFLAKPSGPYFPGFTLVSALIGLIPGLIIKYIRKDINYNLLNIIFISLLSLGFASVFIFKGLLRFDGGVIIYNGQPLNPLIIGGFFLLVAIYIIIPIKMTSLNHNICLNKIIFAVSVNQLITSVILNTYFLSVLYGNGFMVFLPARILTNFFLIPLYSFILASILNVIKNNFSI